MNKIKILLPLISGMLMVQTAQAGFIEDFFGAGGNKQAPQQQYRPQPLPQDNYYQQQIQTVPRTAVDYNHMTSTQKDAYREEIFFRQPNLRSPIRIVKTEWSVQDEQEFDQLVAGIGFAVAQGRCDSVQTCMKDVTINPYASTDPAGMTLYSDCADFPYFLRTYFSFKKGLPFSYAIDLKVSEQPYASAADSDSELDLTRLDKSPYGNQILSRGNPNVPSQVGEEKNFIAYLKNALDTVSTRTFRVGPMTPGAELSDVYPVAIDRVGIRPGTLVHTTGHLYMVYNVDANGTVFLVDAHPGGWLQADKDKFLKSSLLDRSRPDQGLGIFRFRNQRLVGARNINGYYYGGRVVLASNQELIANKQYSLEQYFGVGSNIAPNMYVDPSMYRQAFKGLGFFDYVKMRLSGKDIVLQADKEISSLMNSLCNEMKMRMKDVSDAIDAGVAETDHPDTIPSNIFSADGVWEKFASPSRDSRMKASVLDIMNSSVTKFRLAKAGGYKLAFEGTPQDYQKSLLDTLDNLNKSCAVSYKKSNGQVQVLSFNQVLSRLKRLSFDAYHCPERRWGASGSELATCADGDLRGAWYNAEQGIRNTTSKLLPEGRLSVRSTQDITLDMLQDPNLMDQEASSATNLGTAQVPFSNLKDYLSSQQFLNTLVK